MTKKKLINKIQAIIGDWGGVTTQELELGSSPIINSIGDNIVQLAERFDYDGVQAITYVNDQEQDETDISYSNLGIELLQEIYECLVDYAEQQEKDLAENGVGEVE